MKIFFLVCETKDVYIFLVELDAKNVKDRGGGPLGQIYLVSYFFFLQLAGRGGGGQRFWRLIPNCHNKFFTQFK